MAVIEAPVSKFKKNNLKIYIIALLALAIWCVYDGYINKEWIEEHTNPDGSAQLYLTVNRQGPFYLGAAAVLFAIWFFAIKDKKIIADENELVISQNEKIPYKSIESINKTDFQKKGKFTITYEIQPGHQISRKLSNRKYDNLSSILTHLVAKIS